MPLIFKKKDITKMDVDIIVSSAPFSPVVGEGVDFAIHQAAGTQLLEARKLLGSIAVGEAFITPAFKLPAKFVIHAVGPIWNGGGNNEAEDLKKCYLSALKLATENGCESIALPIISIGEKGYPRDEALIIAKQTIIEFIEENELIVYLVDHDKTFAELSKELFNKLRTYINTNYVNQDYDINYSVSNIRYRKEQLNAE
ncbi:MAG TPA: macro domain-containing protein, partial [Bacilli bacterium]|nr:macro domain-containing protein [Bacilli bacterium]